MKIKKLFTLVPALAVLTLVGSGFSAWVFNEAKTETFNFNGSLNVVTASNLSLTTPEDPKFNVIFDQGGFKNANDVTKGITVTGIDTYTFTLKATDLSLDSNKQIDWSSNVINVSYSLAVTDGSEYVESSLMVNTMNQGISFNISLPDTYSEGDIYSNDYYSYEIMNMDNDGLTGNITFGITVDLVYTDGTVLYYKQGMKPTDSDSWVEMDKSVKSSGIGLNLNISASLN